MTRLCLVRHAQTDWNLQARWQGQADQLLNAAGRLQVRQLAAELSVERFDAIYSSDLRRALATARVVARSHNLRVIREPRLRELDLGAWEGLLGYEIPGLYPAEWAERQRDPFHSRPPGGESVFDLAQRILPVFDELCARHPHGSLLIVSHGLLLSVYLCHLRGLPLEAAYSNLPENAHPIFVIVEPDGRCPL